MENKLSRSLITKFPFLFFIGMSTFWGFYYQANNELNDYGNANFEWLFLLDALVMLPIICFLCIEAKKQALLKSIILLCLAIFVGSYIIPEQSKLVWPYLDNGRYLIVVVFLCLEAVALITVYLAIKTGLDNSEDPDIAIEKPIKKYFGEGPIAALLSFETRLWTYALFSRRIKLTKFCGDQHFTYHKKDGAHSNLFGFICVIALEMPVMHVVLHFTWSPFAANIVTLLTGFSLLFFIAEYRAVAKRPISLLGNELFIRYGLYQPLVIPLASIAKIQKNNLFVKRASHVKRYNYSGIPNIKIELLTPMKGINSVCLGVDDAEKLISAVLAGISECNYTSTA